MSPPPSAGLRTAPGTALCLASGIVTLMLCWLPPVPFFTGVICLFSAWRAGRAARRQPERYRPSAVPLSGTVLVLLAWTFTVIMLMLIGAASGQVVHLDAPAGERW